MPTEPSHTKLPDASGSERALTPSNCSRFPRRWSRPGRSPRSSPRRGASSRRKGRGAQPGRRHGCPARRGDLPAGLLTPSPGPAGAAPAAARSAPPGCFPRRSPALRQDRRRTRPPGGRGPRAHRPPAGPRRPGGPRLLGAGVARDWLRRRGGPPLPTPASRPGQKRGNPPPHLGRRSGARAGTGGGERERQVAAAAREARSPGRGRREEGRRGAGAGASGCGPPPPLPPPHPAVRRASVGPGFKEEPERVAACERARVTSGAAPLGCPWPGPTLPTGWPWRSHLPSGVFENLKSKLFFFSPGNSRGYCCGLRAVNR